MKRIRIISVLLIIMSVFICSSQALAFSGTLDEFSGQCGVNGIYSADSFTVSDGDIYVALSISNSLNWVSHSKPASVKVYLCEYANNKIGNKLTSFTFNAGVDDSSSNYARYYNIPNGTYKLYFVALDNDWITFEGTVFDDN